MTGGRTKRQVGPDQRTLARHGQVAAGATDGHQARVPLARCGAKTIARYVAVRKAGGDPLARVAGSRLIYGFIPKIKELADRSKDKIRADVAYRKITAMGYRGQSGRPSRRSRRCRRPGGWAAAVPAVDP